jgi:protein disulfide-isomerase
MQLHRLFPLAACLFALPALAQAADGPAWKTDYAAAQTDAKAKGDLILLEFTGSDWCPPCKLMKKHVLSTPQFAEAVADNFVLVELDFPRAKEQSAAEKQQNQQLADKYGIMGFPTFIVVDAEGKELGRVVGLPQNGLDGFLAFLKESQNKAKS